MQTGRKTQSDCGQVRCVTHLIHMRVDLEPELLDVGDDVFLHGAPDALRCQSRSRCVFLGPGHSVFKDSRFCGLEARHHCASPRVWGAEYAKRRRTQLFEIRAPVLLSGCMHQYEDVLNRVGGQVALILLMAPMHVGVKALTAGG